MLRRRVHGGVPALAFCIRRYALELAVVIVVLLVAGAAIPGDSKIPFYH
jgi:hypothetical protein